MSHETTGTILNSLLDTFDPESTHYQGVREHFSVHELQRLDELRAQEPHFKFGLNDRLFISYALGKVVMTAKNG
jgi:hypothetical protein